LTLHRVLSGQGPAFTPEFLLADLKPRPERRFTEYSGDLSGRYIGALATASLAYGENYPQLDSLVASALPLQKADGYFGGGFHYDSPVDNDMALLWGNGRLLVGLLEYYRLRPSVPVLAAARRLGDFLVRIGPLMLSESMRKAFGAQHFASSYICWMQQTEGLANLYLATKDVRYRILAEQTAAVVERRPSDHAHGYLTSVRGILDLYHATDDAKFLGQCETAWDDIAASRDLLITGGVPEGWSPNNHRTEGCAEADWLRLSLGLWKATGKQKYLAMAERTLFNEMAFNQYATGDFGHRVYTDTGLPASGAVRAWWCCTLHGLRSFPDVDSAVFRASRDSVSYDLPIDGRIESPQLSATAESSLAQDGTIRITVTGAGRATALLRVRKPEWAEQVNVESTHGVPLRPAEEEGYIVVRRDWRPGEAILVRYRMPLRVRTGEDNRAAFSVGPWLLGAPAAENPDYFNELTLENKVNSGSAEAVPEGVATRSPFTVPVAARRLKFTPAEYSDQPRTVHLRAIAEQAGQPTTSWELRLRPERQA
jgi:DUF1680 family protein